MNCLDIQRAIIIDRYRRNLCCPNYTPKDWWECDVFELTQAGYFREYEIKMTLSDFRADAKKNSGGVFVRLGHEKSENKHQLLAARSAFGPVEFYFVAPEGVIPVEEIPEWAGLMVAEPFQDSGPYKTRVNTVKKAPRLHNQAANENIKKHVESVFYWRFMSLMLFKQHRQMEPEETPQQKEILDAVFTEIT